VVARGEREQDLAQAGEHRPVAGELPLGVNDEPLSLGGREFATAEQFVYVCDLDGSRSATTPADRWVWSISAFRSLDAAASVALSVHVSSVNADFGMPPSTANAISASVRGFQCSSRATTRPPRTTCRAPGRPQCSQVRAEVVSASVTNRRNSSSAPAGTLYCSAPFVARTWVT
jgi:hypothetical protein